MKQKMKKQERFLYYYSKGGDHKIFYKVDKKTKSIYHRDIGDVDWIILDENLEPCIFKNYMLIFKLDTPITKEQLFLELL